jgi:RHS repeat-associated protein
MQTGSDVKYFLADHLGSTTALTDASGAVTSSASYDSFGNATGNLATRYKFTGREYDDFTGLHYYRARWYDSNLGRFISEDPIGFAGGDVNLYGYVWNNPTNLTDPFGRDGFGNDFADYLDERIVVAEDYWRYDDQEWVANGVNKTVADVAYGFSDLFRVGNGLAQAYYCEDSWEGRAAFVLMDVSRASGLFALFGSPAARIARSGPAASVGARFPTNPDDLLPNLPRDANGRILTSNRVRIRPESHPIASGDVYNPRHHGQHYHVEYRLDPKISWKNRSNVVKVKPKGYKPGKGTGFLPGEEFP